MPTPPNYRLQKALDKKNKTSSSFMTKSVKDMTLSDWEKVNASISLGATVGSMFPLTASLAIPLRGVTGAIGAGIDAYQSYDAFKKGDKVAGIYNAVTGTAVGAGAFGSKFMPNTNIDEIAGITGGALDIADLSDASSKVSEIFEPKRKELAKSSVKPMFALGGKVMNRKINVENDEMFETPMGEVGTFKGATHKSGGINATVPTGTKIYSDQIKVGEHTMAERKAYRTKMITKLLTKHGDTKDPFMKATVGRTLESFKAQEAHDLAIQDLAKETETEMFALGTGARGVGKGTREEPYSKEELYNNQGNLTMGETYYWKDSEGKLRTAFWDRNGNNELSVDVANPAKDAVLIGKQGWKSPFYKYDKGNWYRVDNKGEQVAIPHSEKKTINTLKDYYFNKGNFASSLQESPTYASGEGTVPITRSQFLEVQNNAKNSIATPTPTAVTPSSLPPAVANGVELKNIELNNYAWDKNFVGDEGDGGVDVDVTKGKFGEGFTSGDYIGMASSVIGPVAQMVNTINNAKNTKNVVNHYVGVNNKAIQTTNEAIAETGYQKDIAKRALQRVLNMRANSSRESSRGSATSINSLRAMDLGVDTNVLEAEVNASNQLEGTFGQQKMQLLGTRSQLESQAGILEAQGQTQADDANAANLDNFYSNFGQNLASMTEAGQALGRNLNQKKYNDTFLNILPNANRWGIGMDMYGENWYANGTPKSK